MQPENQEVKQEVKTDQAQTVTHHAIDKKEEAPPIKSEENQANWKAFREQREAERKAREQAEKSVLEERARAEALRAALEAVTNKPAPRHYEEELEESEEARIDKRVNAIIAEREKIARQEQAKREQEELPERLRRTYSDFNNVCSAENLDYLEYHYPELAAPLQYMPEGYDKWQAIYKAVKRFVPNNSGSNQDARKAESNLQKPGSLSKPGVTHGGNAMPSAKLDADRKAANWERMQRTLKGLAS